MSKKIYSICILILIIICAMSNINNVYASNHTLGEIVSEGDSFISKGENTSSTIKQGNLENMSDILYNILLTAGIIIAFAVGGILGIKFMTGGIEGQADVKNMLVPYIVGCVIVFGAFGIWKIVLTILQ